MENQTRSSNQANDKNKLKLFSKFTNFLKRIKTRNDIIENIPHFSDGHQIIYNFPFENDDKIFDIKECTIEKCANGNFKIRFLGDEDKKEYNGDIVIEDDVKKIEINDLKLKLLMFTNKKILVFESLANENNFIITNIANKESEYQTFDINNRKGVENILKKRVEFKNGKKLRDIIFIKDDKNIKLKVEKEIIYYPNGRDIMYTTKEGEYTFFNQNDNNEKLIIKEKEDNGRGYEIIGKNAKSIVDSIMNKFLQEVDFLNNNLGQKLANAYLITHIDDINKDKLFVILNAEKNQPKTLKDFQNKYFKEGNKKPEFKVGLISNKNNNHSLAIIIPNPNIYPDKNAYVFDSSYADSKINKNGNYDDINEEMQENIKILNSTQIQHGNCCTLFAMSAILELVKYNNLETIDKIYEDKVYTDNKVIEVNNKINSNNNKEKIKLCNEFDKKIANYAVKNFRQKIKKEIKDEHGIGLTSKYFESAYKNATKFLDKDLKLEKIKIKDYKDTYINI